jgi:multidrug efflux pump subunit AcrA (membrane-fusion protein)
VEGVVKNMYFRYGDSITEGQRLFTIESTKAEQDYHTALTDYLKAKDDYVKNKTSFQGTLALYNAKIVDREDFENQKSQLEISELSYITAEKSLKLAAEKIPGEMRIDYTKLSLSDIDAVKKVLQQQSNLITLVAPSSGVALFAERSGDQDSGAKAITIGAEIKAGQTLLSLGRLVGISTMVYVSETDINKISAGQEVSVTSDALPGMKFKGRVVEVAAQVKASEGASAGLPTVPVAIIVYDITDQQQKLIKVGMSAKVEILIQNKPQIKVPIDAVFQKEGEAMVTIIDPKTGKMVDVPVETGQTEMEEVSIVRGLKAGDKVVVHDNP